MAVGDGAHGVTRPAWLICDLGNPGFLEIRLRLVVAGMGFKSSFFQR
jgi:hypothetical protein